MPSHRKTERKKNGTSSGASSTAATYRNVARPTSVVRTRKQTTFEERKKRTETRSFWKTWASTQGKRQMNGPGTTTEKERPRPVARNRDSRPKKSKERPRPVARKSVTWADAKPKDRDSRPKKSHANARRHRKTTKDSTKDVTTNPNPNVTLISVKVQRIG